MPTVSIVLSVYNGENYCADALESALSQTFTDFELIVIDDGSTDCSIDILNDYAKRDNRVQILQNECNRGLSYSLNKAIGITKGTYIMRMDQDDINLSKRLECQMDVLKENPKVGLVSCFVDALYDSNADNEIRTGVAQFESRRRHLVTNKEEISEVLPYYNVFHHGEVFFRKYLWEKLGGYRPEFTMSEDYDFWLRMIGHTFFYILPKTLYIRRFGKKNSSSVYSNLQEFTAKLARQCYHLRIIGEDDLIYARNEFLQYLKENDLLRLFSDHISKIES